MKTNLKDLVRSEDYIGSVYRMDYDRALVLTDDYRSTQVNGIPRYAFLTVAVEAEGNLQEVLLLQVTGTEPLQIQQEFMVVREELALKDLNSGGALAHDERTQSRLSQKALNCRILGTFYNDEKGKLSFGSDMDSVRSFALLNVFRPRGKALGAIGSFTNDPGEDNAHLDIGVVRYTHTQKVQDTEATVAINVKDIIGTKTFLSGATRSGKSNTLKILLQKVHEYSHAQGKPVAQLVFDPQGEYANSNSQDGSAIANIGEEDEVVIYKTMDKKGSPKEKYLQFNLFKRDNLELTFELLKSQLSSGISAEANYIQKLLAMDFAPLGENATIPQRYHYNRKLLGFYALAFEAFGDKKIERFPVKLGTDLAPEAVGASRGSTSLSSSSGGDVIVSSLKGASYVAEFILRDSMATTPRLSDSWMDDLKSGDTGTLFDQIIQLKEKGRNGVRAAFAKLQGLHSQDAEDDVRKNVWEDIKKGKLIIVDLSRGNTATTQTLSELIVNYLLDQASQRFVDGEPPIPFQIVVEEAHNLFDRDGMKDSNDPWVRISKEAAKYSIGLLYATQEVSSVDKRILSNTYNWFVSTIISAKELTELANYYSYADWLDHLRKVEAVGLLRVKTLSSPYIIPVQIHKFSLDVEKPTSTPKKTETSTTFEPLEF